MCQALAREGACLIPGAQRKLVGTESKGRGVGRGSGEGRDQDGQWPVQILRLEGSRRSG